MLLLINPTMAGGCVAIRQPSWGASGCSTAWSETMSLAFRHCNSVAVQRHGLRPSFPLRISPHESRFQLSLPCYRGVNEKQPLRCKTFEARHRSVRHNFSYKQISNGLRTKFRQENSRTGADGTGGGCGHRSPHRCSDKLMTWTSSSQSRGSCSPVLLSKFWRPRRTRHWASLRIILFAIICCNIKKY